MGWVHLKSTRDWSPGDQSEAALPDFDRVDRVVLAQPELSIFFSTAFLKPLEWVESESSKEQWSQIGWRSSITVSEFNLDRRDSRMLPFFCIFFKFNSSASISIRVQKTWS